MSIEQLLNSLTYRFFELLSVTQQEGQLDLEEPLQGSLGVYDILSSLLIQTPIPSVAIQRSFNRSFKTGVERRNKPTLIHVSDQSIETLCQDLFINGSQRCGPFLLN